MNGCNENKMRTLKSFLPTNKFTNISIILVICGLSDKANAPLSNSNIARGYKFFFCSMSFSFSHFPTKTHLFSLERGE